MMSRRKEGITSCKMLGDTMHGMWTWIEQGISMMNGAIGVSPAPLREKIGIGGKADSRFLN